MPSHDPRDVDPPLEVAPCRSLCAWRPSGEVRAGMALFVCSGCGSEWVRSEPWTPANTDGEVPEQVAREAARDD